MFLTFHAGGQRLAVPLAQAREVLPGASALTLPGAHPWLRGILVREGVAVPVVDLRILAGSAADPADEGSETVVLDAGETRLALPATGAATVEADRAGDEAVEPPEGWTWLSGRVMVGGHACWVLDPEAVARSLGG